MTIDAPSNRWGWGGLYGNLNLSGENVTYSLLIFLFNLGYANLVEFGLENIFDALEQVKSYPS
jgi:hypothetical protein